MKMNLKKWKICATVLGLFLAALLLIIILYPGLTYASVTTHNKNNIYHKTKLDPLLTACIDQATDLIRKSELYNGKFTVDICLNDGSRYPDIIRTVQGKAFGWGFYNKVVLQGTMNCSENFVGLNGYKWNLTQLLAHEMKHCLQFDILGFMGSKPFADIPNWKCEGYAEYISRAGAEEQVLKKNLERLGQNKNNSWCIRFADSTIAPVDYYQAWNLVQFCMDVKGMTFTQLLADSANVQVLKRQMVNWYSSNNQSGKALR